jgi:hypothetical protein
MQGQKKERWMELAGQIANEQNAEKFDELVRELNLLLNQKNAILRPTSKSASVTPVTDGGSDTQKAVPPESKKF